VLIILPFLIFASSLYPLNPCEDFLLLIGQREISTDFTHFIENCGPFEEQISNDFATKTLTNEEKGIEITMTNQVEDPNSLAKYEVFMIELTAFTDEGGFKGNWPFGFLLGMDSKLVKKHIESLNSVTFHKKDLSKKSSSFTYTGAPNSALAERQIKVSIFQFDGKTITSMRLRLN